MPAKLQQFPNPQNFFWKNLLSTVSPHP